MRTSVRLGWSAFAFLGFCSQAWAGPAFDCKLKEVMSQADVSHAIRQDYRITLHPRNWITQVNGKQVFVRFEVVRSGGSDVVRWTRGGKDSDTGTFTEKGAFIYLNPRGGDYPFLQLDDCKRVDSNDPQASSDRQIKAPGRGPGAAAGSSGKRDAHPAD